ncbi:flagellin lysine-N-methylase [Clostridium haemolyticum]|uniref:Flagellar protein FliB n=1 Tax=Clostridium haemolyticum NCTC 9693 TaxID=1443114 RepID=A0ABR4TDJ9_CLOHA|nr:flagellin lysine-N-methylase [Clostridium haemolyticum]KEI16198.1 flagellar protein FliB [Clostridium haemolyticum NCTC 9693]KGN03766.1 flagellar protein FliB [Clostridium haemolyticum NCTC 8350]
MILIPEYLKNFRCIGSECEDTCCKGWRVDIDKKTYNLYKKSKNIKLKPLFQKHIKRNHNNKTEKLYGKLKMNSEGYCPFLDENRMCGLYKEIGEEKLSHICKIYPRETRSIEGKLEQSLTLSCPEVVRIALFNEKGIEFQEVDKTHSNINIPEYLNASLNLNTNITKYFWDIRIFSLTLLQNRNYTLDERMMILGIVYEKLQILVDNKKYDYILGLLDEMNEIIESNELKESFSQIPINIEMQMRIAKELADVKIVQGVSFDGYLECIKETLQGIKFKEENTFNNVLEEYTNSYNNYLKPYITEKEYVLENFLVNEFFRRLFPFGSFKSIWESYIYLSAIYSMLKFHLVGISAFNKEMNDKLLVKVVYNFSRVMLHNPSYLHQIINLMKENKFDTLAHMCILIKS